MLKQNNFSTLKTQLIDNGGSVVFYGAGTIGKLALNALNELNIKVDHFHDSAKQKFGTVFCDVGCISFDELQNLDKNSSIFLSMNFFSAIIPKLEKIGFKNTYDCVELLEKTNFSLIKGKAKKEKHNFGEIINNGRYNQKPIEVERQIKTHRTTLKTYLSDDQNSSKKLYIKYMDVVITERCSMKCIDCANLMQYYVSPKNSDLNLLFKSITKSMNAIDHLDEFRVLGGEPFMNKEIHKIIKFLLTIEKVKKIAIYTNATIVPKGLNLECLKNDKVMLDITHYKTYPISARNHPKLIEACNLNNIKYNTHTADTWQDSGRIIKYERTENELKEIFANCCVGDVLTILNGKMYRCPFSANDHNINAIPFSKDDIIDLNDDKITLKDLKSKIEKLYVRNNKSRYLTACKYCKGRDFNTNEIPAGIQTKKRLENPKYS